MADIEMGNSPTAESIFAALSPEQRKTLEAMFLASNKESGKIIATSTDKPLKWPE